MSGPDEEAHAGRKNGRPRLGNPLQDENVAFRWLIGILVAAVVIALIAKLISAGAAVVVGILVLVFAAAVLIRSLIYMMGSPDEEDPEGVQRGQHEPEPGAGSSVDGPGERRDG